MPPASDEDSITVRLMNALVDRLLDRLMAIPSLDLCAKNGFGSGSLLICYC